MAQINFTKYLDGGDSFRKLFVGNPIIVHARQPAAYAAMSDLIFFVTVIPQGESSYTLEGKFVDQECILDLSGFLSSFPKLVVPDLQNTGSQQLSATGFVYFHIQYGILDFYRNQLDLVTDNLLRPAFLGGLYPEQFPDSANLGYWMWLSQQLRSKKLKIDHLNFEFFYCYLEPVSGLQVKATIYHLAGATEEKTENLTFSVSGGYYRITILPLARLLQGVDLKDVWRVVVDFSAYPNISDRITYEIDRTKRRHERLFLFQNSLGGMDTICFTGQRTRTRQIDRKSASKDLRYDYKASDNQQTQYDANLTTSFKQDTGYFPKSVLDYLQREFFPSPVVYEIFNGKLKAVNLLTNKIDYDEDNISPQSITFEYVYGL